MEALEFLALVVPFLLMVYLAGLLFIRPPRRVFWASLLGGLVVGVVNLIVDLVAYLAHWWQYTFRAVTLQPGTSPVQTLIVQLFTRSMELMHVPLAFYLTPILIFGSLAFLLIWRFWFGRGRWFSLLLLVGTPLFCIARDMLGGLQKTSYQVWENIPLALVVTIVMWLLAFYPGFWLFWRTARRVPYTPQTDDAATVAQVTKQA